MSTSDADEILTIEIENFNGLVETAFWMGQSTNSLMWWRGQAEDWKLLPEVHRRGNLYDEQYLSFNFSLKAEIRHGRCPARDDYPSWLHLMQHYGLPTRLLDWTESPLVAAFFALEQYQDHKGNAVLWGLDAEGLNQDQLTINLIAGSHAEEVSELFMDAFRLPQNRSTLAKIAAIVPTEMDTRQLLQQSMFTIHGSKEPLNLIPSLRKCLRKIVIPERAKFMCAMNLAGLGISRSKLFPDLDNLARELRARGRGGPLLTRFLPPPERARDST